MNKKLRVVTYLSLIFLLSLSFVSAGWFGDVLGEITGKAVVTCTDSDGSGNYLVKGICTDSNGEHSDMCHPDDNYYVYDYFCFSEDCKLVGKTCKNYGENYVCQDGKCIEESDCITDCINKVCGDNGCGGSCGSCSTTTQTCQDGTCVDKEAPTGLAEESDFILIDEFNFWEDDSSHNYSVNGITGKGYYTCGKGSSLRLGSCGLGAGKVSITFNVAPNTDEIILSLEIAAYNNKSESIFNLFIDGEDFSSEIDWETLKFCVYSNITLTGLSALTQDGEIEIILEDAHPSSCAGDPQLVDMKLYSKEESSVEATCTDSDGGKDYYVKGNTISNYCDVCYPKKWDKNQWDICSKDSSSVYTDNNLLFEYSCNENNYFDSEKYICPNGCVDGACVEEDTLQIKKEWNLIGWPSLNNLVSGTASEKNAKMKTLADLISKITDKENTESLWVWESGDKKWYVYLPGADDFGAAYATSKDFGLIDYQYLNNLYSKSLWVNAKKDFNVAMPEYTLEESYFPELISGWNFVSFGLKDSIPINELEKQYISQGEIPFAGMEICGNTKCPPCYDNGCSGKTPKEYISQFCDDETNTFISFGSYVGDEEELLDKDYFKFNTGDFIVVKPKQGKEIKTIAKIVKKGSTGNTPWIKSYMCVEGDVSEWAGASSTMLVSLVIDKMYWKSSLNSAGFNSIWEWKNKEHKWGVVLPNAGDNGLDYAEEKGFDFLEDVKPNYGYWVYLGPYDGLMDVPPQVGAGYIVPDVEDCIPEYQCEFNPEICPEDGFQLKVCTDIKCDSGGFEENYQCTPGKCSGCFLDEVCYPLGYIKDSKYCDVGSFFVQQKTADASCENNFECKSNLCISEKCVSGSLWDKFIEWFKALFGDGGDEEPCTGEGCTCSTDNDCVLDVILYSSCFDNKVMEDYYKCETNTCSWKDKGNEIQDCSATNQKCVATQYLDTMECQNCDCSENQECIKGVCEDKTPEEDLTQAFKLDNLNCEEINITGHVNDISEDRINVIFSMDKLSYADINKGNTIVYNKEQAINVAQEFKNIQPYASYLDKFNFWVIDKAGYDWYIDQGGVIDDGSDTLASPGAKTETDFLWITDPQYSSYEDYLGGYQLLVSEFCPSLNKVQGIHISSQYGWGELLIGDDENFGVVFLSKQHVDVPTLFHELGHSIGLVDEGYDSYVAAEPVDYWDLGNSILKLGSDYYLGSNYKWGDLVDVGEIVGGYYSTVKLGEDVYTAYKPSDSELMDSYEGGFGDPYNSYSEVVERLICRRLDNIVGLESETYCKTKYDSDLDCSQYGSGNDYGINFSQKSDFLFSGTNPPYPAYSKLELLNCNY